MIVLDTNVISEPMRRVPDERVIAWLNGLLETSLFTTSVCVMELRLGVARLPDGKRKANLWSVLDFTLARLFGPRILPFDTAAAHEAARIAALAEATGNSISVAESQIAAIASNHGFQVATRDSEPFQQAGLSVVDPWASET